MTNFIPGLELNRRFYAEVVRPLLDQHFPKLPHAAALLGSGSEVLGFDTEMSTDHVWGPTVRLFLRETDFPLKDSIHDLLAQRLPHTFMGYPAHFGESPAEPGTPVMAVKTEGPVNHRVMITTVRDFARATLDYDGVQPLEAVDWLTFPTQKLLEITAGAVYYDSAGELTALRERLAWYPHDVWLYLLACGWQRISQEEHLMPRAGYVGDELGSSLIGARLVRDVMALCFLMERRYAPYPKWFGTAFQRLACAPALSPILWQVQQASTWQTREAALCEAYSQLARMHNALGLTDKLTETPTHFFGRPFKIIYGGNFAEALTQQITDPAVKRLTEHRLIGSIDQFSDSTDLRSDSSLRLALRKLYTEHNP